MILRSPGHGCLLAILLLLTATTAVPLEAADDPLAVQITSPLGRTGIPGTIRIVARVRTAETEETDTAL